MADLDDWVAPGSNIPSAAANTEGTDDWIAPAQPGIGARAEQFVHGVGESSVAQLKGLAEGAKESSAALTSDFTTPLGSKEFEPSDTGLAGELLQPFAPSIGTAVGVAARAAKIGLDVVSAPFTAAIESAKEGPAAEPIGEALLKVDPRYTAEEKKDPALAKQEGGEFLENAANIPLAMEGAMRPAVRPYEPLPPSQSVPTGPVADAYITHSPAGPVLNAFGEGAAQNWGATGLTDERMTELTQGIGTTAADSKTLKAITQSYADLTKAFNEAMQRPAALTAVSQLGPEFVTDQLSTARALGVIGEGEAGWKGVVDPTEQQIADRQAAQSLIPQPIEERPAEAAPDIHEVARSIAPDVFGGPNGYDALLVRQDTFRRWIDELDNQRREQAVNGPEAVALRDQIDTALQKVGGVEDRLTKAAAARIEDARAQLDAMANPTGDSPDMARVRQALAENDYKMRDLSPQVSAAYREAAQHVPAVEEAPQAPVEAVQQPEPVAAPAHVAEETPQPAPTAAQAGAVPGAAVAGTEAPQVGLHPVPQDIAADVSRKLIAAGRPADEAAAAAQLVAAHYEARAERFGGAKGTGAELYAREAPEIKPGRQRVKEFAQGKLGSITFRNAETTIRLMKDANASTFLHETGHQWLEELMRDAGDDQAPADLTEDAQTVRDYLGAKDGEEISTRQHEKFARSFERYMMEGRAPSQRLADVFAKFKDWLTKIYETVNKLRAPITDDIRDVFDRLISTPSERAVITAEEPISKSFADIHEADARETAPEHAAPVRDNIESEIDQIADRSLPDVGSELAATKPVEPIAEQTGGNPESGGTTGAVAGETGNAEEPGKVAEGGGGTRAEGGDIRAESSAAGGNVAGQSRAEQPTGPDTHFGPESELIDKAGNIRLDNLETPEDVKDVIRRTARENNDFFSQRRGKLSDPETIALADALGMDASMLNTRKIGQAFNAEEVIAARKLLVQSASEVHEAMIKAADGTDADVQAYGEIAIRHRMIQEQVAGITAEAGRALRAFRKLAGTDLANSVESIMGVDKDKTLFQLREEAKLGKGLKTPEQTSQFINDVWQSRREKIKAGIQEYYINALISGPMTHMRYAVGNAINAIYTPLVEIPLAASIAHLTGEDGVYAHEALSQLYAIGKGSRDGLVAAIEDFQNRSSRALPGEHVSADFAGPRPRAIPGKVGAVLNVPGQSVAAIHTFFKVLRYEQNIAGMAYRAARDEGLEGAMREGRIASLTKNPTPEMMESASADALRELYMRPTEYTSTMGALNRAINSSLALKIIVPFMKIGSEITRNAFVERTPLGLFSKDVRANLMGENGPVEQQMQGARMAGGVALISVTAMMAAEGLATGDGPEEPKARAAWLLTHQPNHITIGSISIPYQGLGGLGMLMRFTANAYETGNGWDGKDYGKLAVSVLEGVSKSVLDENFMRGVKDMLDAVYHPDEYGKQYLRGFVTNWLPFSVGMGQVAREIDPYQRQAQTLFDAARDKVPFVSENLHPRYDMFGNPMLNAGPRPEYANDPVVRELQSLQTGIGRLEDKIRGVKLTDQQYDDFCRMTGRMTYMQLRGAVSAPGFDNQPAVVRQGIIHAIIDSVREQVRKQVATQSMGTPNDIIAQANKAKTDQLAK